MVTCFLKDLEVGDLFQLYPSSSCYQVLDVKPSEYVNSYRVGGSMSRPRRYTFPLNMYTKVFPVVVHLLNPLVLQKNIDLGLC